MEDKDEREQNRKIRKERWGMKGRRKKIYKKNKV